MKWVRYHTKRLLAGSEREENGGENVPIEERLAIEAVRSPATIDVTTNEVVASTEITVDTLGTKWPGHSSIFITMRYESLFLC